jgi:hypothetical protein
MEINTLSSVDETTTSATSMIVASLVSPTQVRFRTPIRSSMPGVGAYRVPASWLAAQVVDPGCGDVIATKLDPQDPQFSTHKFSTRQGPPSCSPPV